MISLLRVPFRIRLCGVVLVFSASNLFSADERPLLDSNGRPAGFQTLELGAQAPDFDLPGIDGRDYSLDDFAAADILMVLFTSNHCPTSHSIEQRLQKLRNDYRDRSFALVAINPNHPDGLGPDELCYGEYNDSFEEMKPYAESNGWDFPYIYDGEKQLTARAYGCLATPHVFIFDRERNLRYKGRFDDSRYIEESSVKSPDARNALEDLFAGREVSVPETKPHGCSTKWRERLPGKIAAQESWKKIPVALDTIDVPGVAHLRANPTGKYRLVNLWATWCAPCVAEFPVLVSLSRQFHLREFELITISLDEPEQELKVQEFLQRQGAGLVRRIQKSVEEEGRRTNHYLLTDGDQDALMTALDPEWPGPLPHTVLIAPGGEIVWRHSGPISMDEARMVIIDTMTRYYSLPSSD